MNRITLLFALIFPLAISPNAYSQSTTDTRQQYASLGDFPLENGQHIADCKIGYRTFGKLNATRSNAVIYPTAGGGTTSMMELYGGLGQDVDTTRFYVILIDALGNGVSSSPSNSTSQPKTSFPQFSIRDMVNTQYKMLTAKMNIHHLAAVVGNSMAGCQALQWAVSYPDFMDKVVSCEGTPKPSTHDLLWMYAYVEAVKSDTGYHGGNYTVNPPVPMASYISQMIITTPANLTTTVPVDSFPTWFASLGKYAFFDCNNFLSQVKAVMLHDISSKAGGSMENAAKVIKAKVLIIANKQDQLFNQAISIKFAGMTNAELVVMDDELGHLIFNEKAPTEATRKFLYQ